MSSDENYILHVCTTLVTLVDTIGPKHQPNGFVVKFIENQTSSSLSITKLISSNSHVHAHGSYYRAYATDDPYQDLLHRKDVVLHTIIGSLFHMGVTSELYKIQGGGAMAN